ncbi:MAG TPA: proprotein convertase P-domain-containing protein [Pyrinomonadaceae bacterium]|jgi:subtilisin-like proprotein convertase family protein
MSESDRATSPPAERTQAAQAAKGTWTLTVEDKAEQDTGRVRSFALELHF